MSKSCGDESSSSKLKHATSNAKGFYKKLRGKTVKAQLIVGQKRQTEFYSGKGVKSSLSRSELKRPKWGEKEREMG